MANIYTAYIYNSNKGDNGVAAVIRGMDFTIGYIENANYQTELDTAIGACGGDCLACPNSYECETTALSEAVLLGWADIDNDGGPLAYSAANAKTVLDDLPEFKAQVLEFANDLSNFV